MVEHLDLRGQSEFPFQLDGESTVGRDDEFYINNELTRNMYSKPLETIAIQHGGMIHSLTYRQARNLLMQDGELRKYFRNYKRECNQGEIENNDDQAHGRACHSLQFRDGNDAQGVNRQFTIEGCINGILQRDDNDDVKRHLVAKLQHFNPRTWREEVKRVSYKKPRLDSNGTRWGNRTNVTGERPPQRLRSEKALHGGDFKAFHTMNPDISMHKGAIKHRLNLKHNDRNHHERQHALTNNNWNTIRRIIQMNQVRSAEIQDAHPDRNFNVHFTGFEEEAGNVIENIDIDNMRTYSVWYTGGMLIPIGTIVNIHVNREDWTEGTNNKVTCTVVGGEGAVNYTYGTNQSFSVIMEPGYTITGFDFNIIPDLNTSRSVSNVVPAKYRTSRAWTDNKTNGFNQDSKRLISTGNTNGTFGVPMLLAKAGISRKDTTRSTLDRQRASKERVCRNIQTSANTGWSKETAENYKLRDCHDLESYEELYKKRDIQTSSFSDEQHTRTKAAIRQYNLDEALDIMIAPDPEYRIGPSPFETEDGVNWNGLDGQRNFETFVIEQLTDASMNGKITGNLLLQHLQNTYPQAYKLQFKTQDAQPKATVPIDQESNSDSEYDSDDEMQEPFGEAVEATREPDPLEGESTGTGAPAAKPAEETGTDEAHAMAMHIGIDAGRNNSLYDPNLNVSDDEMQIGIVPVPSEVDQNSRTSSFDQFDPETTYEEMFMKNGGALRLRRKKKKTKKRR